MHNLCQTLEPSKSKYLTTSKVGQQDGQHLCGGRHITFVRGASETYVGAVGCWCLCAPQLALVIRPQAGRPPTPRPTPPRTPTPDDSVSSPTQPNLLATVITSSEFTENRHVLYATFLWTRSWFPAESSILSKSILACHNPGPHSNGGDNDSWDGKGVGDIGGGALRRRQACCGLRWVNKRGRRSCLSLSSRSALT